MFPSLLPYGRAIVAVNVLAAVVHHIDYVIVGRMLGTPALGLYQMAYRLPEMTIVLFMRVVSTVMFHAFTSLQHQADDLRRAYVSTLRYVAHDALPESALLALLA